MLLSLLFTPTVEACGQKEGDAYFKKHGKHCCRKCAARHQKDLSHVFSKKGKPYHGKVATAGYRKDTNRCTQELLKYGRRQLHQMVHAV